MNKGLEAFNELKVFIEDIFCDTRQSRAFTCTSSSSYLMPFIEQVETELKRLKVLDTVKSKPLEALKRLNEFRFEYEDYEMCETNDYMIVENALKQFEIKTQKQDEILRIIKKKKVDCWTFSIHCWMDYREFERGVTCSKEKLTQQEFDLLKEWLK